MDNQYDNAKKQITLADKKKNERKIDTVLKYGVIALCVIALAGLIVYKIYNPDAKIAWIITLGLFLFAIILTAFLGGFEWIRKRFFDIGGKLKEPERLTEEQLTYIAKKKIIDELGNMLKAKIKSGIQPAGKSRKEAVFFYVAPLLFRETRPRRKIAYIFINANHPELNRVEFDVSDASFKKILESLATDADESEPNVEEIERENLFTGGKEKVTRIMRPEKKEEKKETKEDELE